jgi:hypothetical protein
MDSIVALINIAEDLKADIASREAFIELLIVLCPRDELEARRFKDRNGMLAMEEQFIITKLKVALESLQKEMAKIKV